MDATRSRAAEPEAQHVNQAAAPGKSAAASAPPVTPALAAVIDGGPNVWFVASGSIPGAWWAVQRILVGERQWQFICPCPWGASQAELPYGQRIVCRHLRALVAHQNAQARRPVSPPNVSALVD